MNRSEQIEIANKILNALKSCGYARDTVRLIKYDLGLHPTKDRGMIMKIMLKLLDAGLVERYGTGKYRWGLLRQEWDAANPFDIQERTQYQEPIPATTLPENITPMIDTMRLLIEELRGDVVTLRNRVKIAETEAATTTKEVVIKQNDVEIKIEGTPHAMLERVTRLAAARKNVLMIGPAGCGKTHLASQVAQALGLDFAFVSCSAGMSEGHLLGRLLPTGKGGQFVYSRSEFVRCYEEGGVFLFDEVDAADSNTLLVLNAALANGHLAIPNRADSPVAVKHKDFVCLAAANTFGTGADRLYVGRNQLDEAFLDRFRIGQVILDYDSRVEAMLCPDDLLRERLQAYRRNCAKGKVRRVVSTRFLKDAYEALSCGAMDDFMIDEALFGGWREDEMAKAKEGVVIKIRGNGSLLNNGQESVEVLAPGEIMNEETAMNDEDKSYSQHNGTAIPQCPRCKCNMIRMASGKGWRCGTPGNKWSSRTKTWTVCDHCEFDEKKR